MRTEKPQKWAIDDDTLLDAAEKRLQNGDYLGALTMLNKRSGLYAPSADACALYADVYEAMGLYQQAADAWFHFLDCCNEADFAEGYEGLSVAFMHMGNDLQAALFFHLATHAEDEGEDFEPGDTSEISDEDLFASLDMLEDDGPKLRVVGDGAPEPEKLAQGMFLLHTGEFQEAKDKFAEIDEESSDYPAAAGLSAMCTLMLGDENEAQRECEELLAVHPDNVNILTTYCAVLGTKGDKEGARKVAEKLFALGAEETEDLYRIATALCETGMHDEAFRCLTTLKERIPYDETVLFFHAVAAFKTDRVEDAIESLELLTTVYPKKAVAKYYLEHLRMLRDGDIRELSMNYYYRLPEDEYSHVAATLLAMLAHAEKDPHRFLLYAEDNEEELTELLSLAVDEMEGRDEKLQLLAVRVAVRARADEFLRSMLLNYQSGPFIPIAILRELTLRNEENTFGTVFLNNYKELNFHALELGPHKKKEFLEAFADVFSKFALLGEADGNKLCAAAEDIYSTLEEYDVLDYADERAALSAAIYREARLSGGERGIEEIVKLFDAGRSVTQQILDYMM